MGSVLSSMGEIQKYTGYEFYIFLANQRLLKNKADKIQVKEQGNVGKDHVPHALAVVSNKSKLCNHSLH